MNIEHQKITLELNSVSSYETLEAHRGDKKSRYIDCNITSNGVLQSLQNLTATIDATVNDVVVADGNSVAIDNDIATIELTENMLSLPGRMKIDLKLSDDNSLITTQTFYVRVGNSVINETSKFKPTGGSIDERITAATDTANEAKEQSQSNTANIEKLKNEKINTYQLGTVTDLAELPVFIKNSIYYGLCKGFGSVFGLSDTIEIGFMVTTIPRSSSTKDYAMWFLTNGTVWTETISTKKFVKITNSVKDVLGSENIEDNAVTTNKIANNSISQLKMQANSIGYDELQEGSVREDILSPELLKKINSGGSGGTVSFDVDTDGNATITTTGTADFIVDTYGNAKIGG